MKKRKIRYAVVGLGHIAQNSVLPSFRNAKNSEIVALVSSDDKKLRKLGKLYSIDLLCGYDQYDDLLSSGEIDAVYIALPNHLHHQYSIRASRAGIHVLCEKPMALTVNECEEMIAAARESRTKLMIAYRLHFEESNLKAIKLVQSKKLGEPKFFNSVFAFTPKTDNIRLREETGGGPLYDIGVYCINAARYLFGAEPLQAMAVAVAGRDRRTEEVEESLSASLLFPEGRLATFTVSFAAAPVAHYQVVGTKGDLFAENAYEYEAPITQHLTIKEKTKKATFRKRDQFGPELIYFSDCILKNREPEPAGEEGLADIRILQAIQESARTGRAVNLERFRKTRRPGPGQQIDRPVVQAPDLVDAESPVDEAA